jgi:putative transposase
MSRERLDFGTDSSAGRLEGCAPSTFVVRMPRPPRLQVPNGIYHVTARGNRRQAIFVDDLDRRRFLQILERVVARSAWRPRAYCLMSNHYHFVVETPKPTLSAGMHCLNSVYARKFNERHGVDGHLFESRFQSFLVETERHLHDVLLYVATNPVRAGLCAHPSEWPWSSFAGVDGGFAFDR